MGVLDELAVEETQFCGDKIQFEQYIAAATDNLYEAVFGHTVVTEGYAAGISVLVKMDR